MSDKEFIPPELDEDGIAFMRRIKTLLDGAFKEGYMEGVKSAIGNDGERVVKRIVVTPSSMIAFLIILLGGVFSLGMYIGGLNG
jgi:hypothetical protein